MSNDAHHYYSNAARQQIGPVSRDDLQAALLAPDWYGKAMIWREGWEKWLPWPEAARLLGLTLPPTRTADPIRPVPPAMPEPVPANDAKRAYTPVGNVGATGPSRPSDNLYASPQASVLPPTTVDFDYASFWTRFAAYFIDRMIILLIAVALIAVSAVLVPSSSGGDSGANVDHLGTMIIFIACLLGFVLLPAFYFIYFEQSESGMTPGKRLFGIRVADLSGRRISIGAAFVRNLIAAISSSFYCIGHIVAAFTERHQALHDLGAQTIVIHTFDANRAASGQPPRRKGAGTAAILIVVVAFFMIPVLGIIAAIALPAYQDYTIRAKVSQVVTDTAALRSEVQSYRISNDDRCPTHDDASFQPAAQYQGAHYTSVELSSMENDDGERDCLLLVTLDHTQSTALDGQVLILELSSDQAWTCHSNTINQRYMPSGCRDNQSQY